MELTGNKWLARQLRGSKTLREVVDKARRWFFDEKCMLLVDDIWRASDIGYNSLTTLKSMLSDECCLVYSTRDQRLRDSSDKIITFEPRDSLLASRMLRRHGGFGDSDARMSEEYENAFREILKECAGLPLALGIAGASVGKISEKKSREQKENTWADFAQELFQKRYSLKSGSTLDYSNLENIVDTSLNILAEDYREEFQALCHSEAADCAIGDASTCVECGKLG